MTSVEGLIVAITLFVAVWYVIAVLADYVTHRRRKARADLEDSIDDIRIACARDHRSLMAGDSLEDRRQLAELCRQAALRRLSLREWNRLQQRVMDEYPTTLRTDDQGYQDWLCDCMVIAAKRAIKG